MSQPIPLPKDLQPGDILLTNHGQRVKFVRYDTDMDVFADTAILRLSLWRPTGISYYGQDDTWIVAIERKGNTVDLSNFNPTIPDRCDDYKAFTDYCLAVMQAWKDGKQIATKANNSKNWCLVSGVPMWDWLGSVYAVIPEPTPLARLEGTKT